MSENKIDANGISIQTYEEILNAIINGQTDIPGLKQIYGSDINVDSNSPDGQMINIFALSKKDMLDLIVQDYSSKDPDQAVGVALDAVSQLCGIYRKGGSYSETSVSITVDRELDLKGLDDPDAVPFTVSDNVGNVFYLMESVTVSVGTTALNFRAKNIGRVQIEANTITTAVTVILGVTAINNPSAPYQEGTDQETDADFRIRRQKSVGKPSQGYLQSLYAALLNIPGVSQVSIYENVTGSTDGDGIPSHSIWVIVLGGTDEEVAESIFSYRNAGCGMKGAEEVEVEMADGNTFTIKFDRPDEEDLYMEFTVTPIGGGAIDLDYLKEQLVALYEFGIYEPADVTTIATIVRSVNPNVVVSDAGVGIAVEHGNLATVSVGAAGTGYNVGNILTLVQAGASLGTVEVLTVDGGGEILTVAIDDVGQGYSVAAGLAVTGGDGTGATIDVDSVVNDFNSIKYPTTKKDRFILATSRITINT